MLCSISESSDMCFSCNWTGALVWHPKSLTILFSVHQIISFINHWSCGGVQFLKGLWFGFLLSTEPLHCDSISILEFMVGLDCSAFVDGFQYGLF